MMTKKMRRSLLAWCVLAGVVLVAVLLVLNGYLWPNMPSKRSYPVRGVDVSHYQGTIDWQVLAKQELTFAFVKATEGSGSVDGCFAANWEGACGAGLAVGAYHFFSFDSAGSTQAANFLSVVPQDADALPPVIDLECYRSDNLPPVAAVQEELSVLLETLRDTYGKTPIIYTTNTCWETYLKGTDWTYTLWIRSIFTPPSSALTPAWTFWQYNPRGRLSGYSGEEHFIDLNAYCGTAAEFRTQFGLDKVG